MGTVIMQNYKVVLPPQGREFTNKNSMFDINPYRKPF